jgi:hypothetical protein
MNTSNNRNGVHALDAADLEEVGASVVGGVDFDAAAQLTVNLLTCAAIATAAFCACMNRDNRRAWWQTFMDNFARPTVANTADEAGNIEAGEGDTNAAVNLGNIELTLDNAQNTDPQAIANVEVIAYGTWTCG